MRLLAACFSLLTTAALFAQNLVVNPGFEDEVGPQRDCTFARNDQALTLNCRGWNGFFQQTPDYHFYSPNTLNCTVPRPRSGTHALGLICFHPRETGFYHEHAQASLAGPMEVGHTYQLQFWATEADSAGKHHLRRQLPAGSDIKPVACNNLGIYFTTEANDPGGNFGQQIGQLGIRPQVVFGEILTTRAGEWRKVTANFKADKPYRFFTIGNFSDDATVSTAPKVSGQPINSIELAEGERPLHPIAYYLFDDFYLGESPPPPDLDESLTGSGQYVFQNLLFDFGKSVLMPGAFAELDGLVGFLQKNPKTSVEIGGHTDNVGDDAANLQLSDARSRSVVAYLISKKIGKTRLTARGYGEGSPVADNADEAGRAKNRRVECRLVK